MFRSVLAAAVLAAFTAVAFAQADLVAARKALMKSISQDVDGTLRDMAGGSRPYDAAAVEAIFVRLADAAQKMPPLYAESTRNVPPSGRYNLSQKAWGNKADFDARIVRFAEAVAEARPKAKGQENIGEVQRSLRASCSACHDVYRVRN